MRKETIKLFGTDFEVTENNIIDTFQYVCKHFLKYTKDCGNGMRSVEGDMNVMYNSTIIKCDPENRIHNVLIELDGHLHELKDFYFGGQIHYLKSYYDELQRKEKKGEKIELETMFIRLCESTNAKCLRNEYMGKDCEKEIIYCTNKGVVFQYFDNNGNDLPTIQKITYPKPSELLDKGIIGFLIDECLSAGMTAVIRDITNFLDLPKSEQDKQGLPYEYLYEWVWENGKWDKDAKYDDLTKKDSLLAKCNEYASNLVEDYIGSNDELANELSTIMHKFITEQDGFSYFPKK